MRESRGEREREEVKDDEKERDEFDHATILRLVNALNTHEHRQISISINAANRCRIAFSRLCGRLRDPADSRRVLEEADRASGHSHRDRQTVAYIDLVHVNS